MSTQSLVIGLLCRESTKKMLLNQKPTFRPRLLYKAGVEVSSNIYFFVANDLMKSDDKVKGIYFDPSESKWKRKLFAFPHLIYRLGGNYTRGKYPRFHRALQRNNTLVLNRLQCFDKFEQYHVLNKNKNLVTSLPVTRELSLKRTRVLFNFIDKHSKVFIKSKYSYQSIGVMRVYKKEASTYEYLYFHKHQLKRGLVSKKKLLTILARFFKGKSLFIQKEISLISNQDNIFDIRVELHRGMNGELNTSGYCVNEHSKEVFKSRNSKSHLLINYIRQNYNYSEEDLTTLTNKIDRLCSSVYETLESRYGPLGEVGIDLGQDREGKLWIIEANLCCGKRSLYNTYSSELVKKSYLEMFNYGIEIIKEKGMI